MDGCTACDGPCRRGASDLGEEPRAKYYQPSTHVRAPSHAFGQLSGFRPGKQELHGVRGFCQSLADRFADVTIRLFKGLIVEQEAGTRTPDRKMTRVSGQSTATRRSLRAGYRCEALYLAQAAG